MIDLSQNRINTKAPYKVTQIENTTFFFTTQSGILYSAGFVQDFSFMESGVYQFFISNVNKKHEQTDNNIFKTLRIIIEDFFENNQYVMLYICDNIDDKQAYRDRLFKLWFNTYIENVNFTMFNEQIILDNTHYFAGIILRKDHPLHNQIITAFHDFVSDLPDKLDRLTT